MEGRPAWAPAAAERPKLGAMRWGAQASRAPSPLVSVSCGFFMDN